MKHVSVLVTLASVVYCVSWCTAGGTTAGSGGIATIGITSPTQRSSAAATGSTPTSAPKSPRSSTAGQATPSNASRAASTPRSRPPAPGTMPHTHTHTHIHTYTHIQTDTRTHVHMSSLTGLRIVGYEQVLISSRVLLVCSAVDAGACSCHCRVAVVIDVTNDSKSTRRRRSRVQHVTKALRPPDDNITGRRASCIQSWHHNRNRHVGGINLRIIVVIVINVVIDVHVDASCVKVRSSPVRHHQRRIEPHARHRVGCCFGSICSVVAHGCVTQRSTQGHSRCTVVPRRGRVVGQWHVR